MTENIPHLADGGGLGIMAGIMPAASSRLLRGSQGVPSRELPVPHAVLCALFDHLPDVVFFIKDRTGRYLAANRTLAERCGAGSPENLCGSTVAACFPPKLAARYAAQDEQVLRTGRPVIDRLELHWQRRGREGWCLTTKLPLRDDAGHITGLIGVSRDLRAPGDKDGIPASLTAALDWLEEHFSERITPPVLARKAALSPAKFARLIKRIFQLTPLQLITQTRLSAAARMLTESGCSVAEIAIECGFYDHSAFARAFRSATGVTPTEFRAAGG
jgi:PAS domain S-box-containing protein